MRGTQAAGNARDPSALQELLASGAWPTGSAIDAAVDRCDAVHVHARTHIRMYMSMRHDISRPVHRLICSTLYPGRL
jgi:hypothetical protein